MRTTWPRRSEARVQEAAHTLGLETLLRRKPAELSGGQRQRVALGRAIVRQPSVFLMDEPLSNLDAKLRVQTRRELIKLHRRLQTTFIYVTHDQVEAMTMGERIAILKDGLLQQVDRHQNVYQRPANVFVASFISSPAMNFFDAELATEAMDLWPERRRRDAAIACAAQIWPSYLREASPSAYGRAWSWARRPPRQTLRAARDSRYGRVAGRRAAGHVLHGDNTIQARLDPIPLLREANMCC
jgi:ABC-type sugar transport system ATPase subunit